MEKPSSSDTSRLIAADRLTKDYDEVRALADVSFKLGEGITGLVGVNGAGKSTLLMILAGALRPGQGRVLVGSDDLYQRRGRRQALHRIAFVPQLPVFPKNLTAREVVSYLCWMRGVSSGRADARAREALVRVGLEGKVGAKIGALSGGMLRRVALAQALVGDAEVLLLDEPSTGLDPKQRRAMVELLADLPGTVLISSHVMEDIADLSQRVLVLDSGELRFDGGLQELVAQAPEGTPAHRAAEAGFLSLCTRRDE